MKKRVNHEGTRPRAMIKQFLKHGAAGINYSSNVAKAINFIGRRPGYGSSVTVTAALLQPVVSYASCSSRARANTLLTWPFARQRGKLRKSGCCSAVFLLFSLIRALDRALIG